MGASAGRPACWSPSLQSTYSCRPGLGREGPRSRRRAVCVRPSARPACCRLTAWTLPSSRWYRTSTAQDCRSVCALAPPHAPADSHRLFYTPTRHPTAGCLLGVLVLCGSDQTETHSEDQAGLKFRDLPATASNCLGLKLCDTTAQRDATN